MTYNIKIVFETEFKEIQTDALKLCSGSCTAKPKATPS